VAFDDLTDKQRELAITIIEELESGGCSEDFLAKCGRSRDVEIGWVLVFTTVDGATEPIRGDFRRTDLYTLKDAGYVTLIERHRDEFTCALRQKARDEYGVLKRPSPEPLPETLDFSFITEPDLRSIIEGDYEEIRNCLDVKAYKATIVMCGSVMEALLLDALLKDEARARRSAKAPKDSNTKVETDFRRWTLKDMIEVAVNLTIIPDMTAGMTDAVRQYRNLIHPAVGTRKQITPEKEEANAARSALDLIIKNLRKSR
jgi:hypothetical protein